MKTILNFPRNSNLNLKGQKNFERALWRNECYLTEDQLVAIQWNTCKLISHLQWLCFTCWANAFPKATNNCQLVELGFKVRWTDLICAFTRLDCDHGIRANFYSKHFNHDHTCEPIFAFDADVEKNFSTLSDFQSRFLSVEGFFEKQFFVFY